MTISNQSVNQLIIVVNNVRLEQVEEFRYVSIIT